MAARRADSSAQAGLIAARLSLKGLGVRRGFRLGADFAETSTPCTAPSIV
jgi:hypothetical protein